jgi:hypothetical protein
MDIQIIKNSLQKQREELRKNAVEKKILKRHQITRLWYRNNKIIDIEIEMIK